MADINNPLNNPGLGELPVPAEHRNIAPEPVDDELGGFLDEIFDTAELDDEPAAEPAPVSQPPTRERTPTSLVPSATPDQPEPEPEPSDHDLQRQIQQQILAQLQRMEHPPEPEPEPPRQMTPDEMVRQYQPQVQEAVEAGWLGEEFALLNPREAALMVHLYTMGTRLELGVQQTQQFTEREERDRTVAAANQQIDAAINEVAARGEIYGALGDDAVKAGFREFLINDVNPKIGQVTPDFLARQFYAYNHELILSTVRQGQTDATTPAADLTQQEGGSARAGGGATNDAPEFVDLLEGMAASRWYN